MARRTFVLTVPGCSGPLWLMPRDTDTRPLTSRTAASCIKPTAPRAWTRRRRRASINLGSGKFRRGTTDDEIVKIILGGIPGTAMPPSSFSEGQAGRSLRICDRSRRRRRRLVPGNAARGQTLFTGKGQCRLHGVAGVGGRNGPSHRDRGRPGARSSCDDRLSNSADIRSDHRPVQWRCATASTITGRLLNQDTFTLQLLDASARLRLDMSTVREVTIPKESPMPSYTGQARRAGSGRSRHLSDDAEGPAMRPG